jgi:hypothetical protein
VEIVAESCLLKLYCGLECALFYMANCSYQCQYSFIEATTMVGFIDEDVLQDRTERARGHKLSVCRILRFQLWKCKYLLE